MSIPSDFGPRLRWWRTHRGQSQLALAGAAEISQRHLSFLESGRTAPSRDMVLRLAAALDVPLRQQNALLLAAGFAPMWRESALAAPELAQVMRAVGHMLDQQEPYPAFVVDRRWNLLRANRGAARMTEFLLGPPADPAAPNGPVLTTHFRKGDTSLRLFTTIATLCTAHDVTLQEIRIESFFPADAASAELMRAWA